MKLKSFSSSGIISFYFFEAFYFSMKSAIHQPKDKLFKLSMADLRVARDFFESHLPEDFLKQLDLNTLKLEKHSFIDEAYKANEADIVYSIRHGDTTAYIYLLCENQGNIDKMMAFRLLVYKVRLMEKHLKQHPKSPLPLIYSMVIYSGEKRWDAPLTVEKLMSEPHELAKQVFFQPYQLIDLHRIPDEQMRQRLWSGLIEFALKYRKIRDMEQFLETLLHWLEEIAQLEGTSYAKIVLSYVIDGVEAENIELFLQKVQEYLSSELRGEAMTLAQLFEQRGLKQGLQQGLQEGLHTGELAMLTGLLQSRFGTISAHYQKRLEQANSETLLKWGNRLLTAKTLEEIFNDAQDGLI